MTAMPNAAQLDMGIISCRCHVHDTFKRHLLHFASWDLHHAVEWHRRSKVLHSSFTAHALAVPVSRPATKVLQERPATCQSAAPSSPDPGLPSSDGLSDVCSQHQLASRDVQLAEHAAARQCPVHRQAWGCTRGTWWGRNMVSLPGGLDARDSITATPGCWMPVR